MQRRSGKIILNACLINENTLPPQIELFRLPLEKNGTPREKLVMGLALHGRSFTLAEALNYRIGQASFGGGTADVYTKSTEYMTYFEVNIEQLKSLMFKQRQFCNISAYSLQFPKEKNEKKKRMCHLFF